ncbi:MAG: NADH-quinone oxidoreductase subunit C [Nitrospinae bacterium]|nr:NADH-quinone oxidoreductase subunit C [Nitrospinota bacterium]
MVELSERIKRLLPDAVLSAGSSLGQQYVVVRREAVVEAMRKLRDDETMLFNFMMDLTAVDYLGKRAHDARYEIVYHLYSLKHHHRIRVKVSVGADDPSLDSIVPVWKGADWFEREAWDLYGITFKGHPNLKRILLYEEFVGHPLRKDYPIKKRQPLIGPEN